MSNKFDGVSKLNINTIVIVSAVVVVGFMLLSRLDKLKFNCAA